MDGAIALWVTLLGTLCWPVCFFWMYRISKRQEDLLRQLQDQTRRIEQLSKEEHELIQEVHPDVGEIKENLRSVAKEVGADKKV